MCLIPDSRNVLSEAHSSRRSQPEGRQGKQSSSPLGSLLSHPHLVAVSNNSTRSLPEPPLEGHGSYFMRKVLYTHSSRGPLISVSCDHALTVVCRHKCLERYLYTCERFTLCWNVHF